jgi:hypothetical protein
MNARWLGDRASLGLSPKHRCGIDPGQTCASSSNHDLSRPRTRWTVARRVSPEIEDVELVESGRHERRDQPFLRAARWR